MVTEDLNRFIVIGINHWNAPVEVRERFSLDTTQKLALLDGAQREEIYSLFVVSTCNRTELFGRDVNSEELIRLLTTYSGGSLDEFHKYGFVHKGRRAMEIGRASCRERVWIGVGVGSGEMQEGGIVER